METKPAAFAGSIPESYHRYMVPVLFRDHARTMAARIAALSPNRVLELACGTGALTQELARALPQETALVATDLSASMLKEAQSRADFERPVRWEIADAVAIPFPDASFDVVTCQFGAMFLPDKVEGLKEAQRILRPGGHLRYATWAGLAENSIFAAIEEILAEALPDEERPFMPTPISLSNVEEIREFLEQAGFQEVDVTRQTLPLPATSPEAVATGFAFGTPLGKYLEEQGHDPAYVQKALATGLEKRLGDPIQGTKQAIIWCATKGI